MIRGVALLTLCAMLCVVPATQGSALPVDDAAHVDPGEIERVAAAVERALPDGRRLEGLVTRSVWQSKDGEPPLDPSRDPAMLTDEHLVRLLGPGHAVVAARPLDGVSVIAGGSMYVTYLSEPGMRAHRGTRDPSALGLALLLQVDLFAPAEVDRPLADVIRRSEPISLTIDGTRATYRFTDRRERELIDAQVAKAEAEGRTPWKVRPTPWPREVTVELGEAPRLLGYAIDVPKAGLDQPPVRDAWSVEAWQPFGDTLLPQTVRRETRSRDGAPYVQLTTLSRLTPLPELAEDAPPAHPLPEGLVVTDERRGLTFVVGSRDIEYQGRRLRLAEPLWLAPGDELDALVERAVEW